MLLLTSQESVLETILLGMKANGICTPHDEKDFRTAYQTYLAAMQPGCFWLREEGVNVAQSLERPMESAERIEFLKRFSGEFTELDDRDQTKAMRATDGPAEGAISSILRGLDCLASTSTTHRDFLEMCIEMIFVESSDVASGGSTSDAVGLIWSNPHPKFEPADMAEFFVHELTHNLLFLDEWIHPHYDYSIIVEEETWCKSAILKMKRPIDKVVHSLVVAAELILYRRMCAGEPVSPKAHPPSDEMADAIRQSIQSLKALPNVRQFTFPRVWQLLDMIETRVLVHQPRMLAHAL